jgi:hypothetical protein
MYVSQVQYPLAKKNLCALREATHVDELLYQRKGCRNHSLGSNKRRKDGKDVKYPK